MKCPLCGFEFREEDCKDTCRGCPMSGACHMMKCPNCNYEIPAEPKLVKVLRAWKEKIRGA